METPPGHQHRMETVPASGNPLSHVAQFQGQEALQAVPRVGDPGLRIRVCTEFGGCAARTLMYRPGTVPPHPLGRAL